MVELRAVSKRYGRVLAVDRVSLEVREGEFFSLLGPSGCGKTTTLRLVAGFERPDGGEVWLSGERVDHLPPERRPIGMVFQSYALFPNMTVYGNVAFPMRLKRIPEERVRRRVLELLEMVHLSGLEGRYPRELSGGQQQRVALARALAREPKVLLLDEPLSALDAKIREELRGELKRLQRETGLTALYVTHDQEEALALSDRIAVMREGRVEQVDTPWPFTPAPRPLSWPALWARGPWSPGRPRAASSTGTGPGPCGWKGREGATSSSAPRPFASPPGASSGGGWSSPPTWAAWRASRWRWRGKASSSRWTPPRKGRRRWERRWAWPSPRPRLL